MSNLTQNNAELLKFDGKPSWGAAFPQAMQHVLAMLIGNITPPMLIAGTCGLSAEEKIMLTQAAMIIGGITTLLQLFPVFGFGMKMPNVMGVAFAYMPILTIIGQQYGIAAIFGSQLVAGFVSIFVGMFIGKIRKFFPPIVSGTVVMSIGLSLYKTAISYIGGGSAAQANGTFGSGKFWFLAILTLIVTLACNFFGKGLVKASGMLIGIVVGFFIPFTNPFLRTLVKLLCIPLVMGLGYELIRVCGRCDNLATRIVAAPGLWMQRLTTKEPDDSMIEVAIAAVTPVLPENPEDGKW